MIVEYTRIVSTDLLRTKEEKVNTDYRLEKWLKMLKELDVYKNDTIYIYYEEDTKKVKRVLFIPLEKEKNYKIEYLYNYVGSANLNYIKLKKRKI